MERAEEHSCILSYGQKSLKGEELSGRIDLVVYAQASPMQEVLKFMSSLGYIERFCLKKLRQ